MYFNIKKGETEMTMCKTLFFSIVSGFVCKTMASISKTKVQLFIKSMCFLFRGMSEWTLDRKKQVSPWWIKRWKAQIPQECLFFKLLWKEKQSMKGEITFKKELFLKLLHWRWRELKDWLRRHSDRDCLEIWVFCSSNCNYEKANLGTNIQTLST